MPVAGEPSYRELEAEVARLREIVRRVRPLIGLLTVRQVIEGGNAAIEAAGLNPWCMNEGRATGDERLEPWWLDDALEGK